MMDAQLQHALSEHALWLAGKGGARLELRGDVADLDLSAMDLRRSDLGGVLVERCRFKETNFSEAFLRKTMFVECVLDGARFDSAILRRASLSACSLRGASLRDADLTRAGGHHLDLRDSDFTGAILHQTGFSDIHVHGSRGLWVRLLDNNIADVDFSVAGDGSDIRDPADWIDHVRGKSRPMKVSLRLGFSNSPLWRVEPNAKKRELPLDAAKLPDDVRSTLERLIEHFGEVMLEHAGELPTDLKLTFDREGEELSRRIATLLPELYDIHYERIDSEDH